MAMVMMSPAWTERPADDAGDALVAAMGLGGVENLFFTSGTELVFYRQAIARAQALGRPTPQLIGMMHEHPSLNAAIGYSLLSGKPSATAAHVDLGTLAFGGPIHTAFRAGVPVLITAEAPATAYPGSMHGARDASPFWLPQTPDQNSIVRQYVKWDHRLEYQDDPGLVVSRALQVALTEPRGPVYLSLPREAAMRPMEEAAFPTVAQMGVPVPAGPDDEAVRRAVDLLLAADNPMVVAAHAGRDLAAVPALVALCELLGLPVVESARRGCQNFPLDHPLYQGTRSLKDADVLLVLEAEIPWTPGPAAPSPDAQVIVVGVDPIWSKLPTYEFPADLRIPAPALPTIRALQAAVERRLTVSDRVRAAERTARWSDAARERVLRLAREAQTVATRAPIDPRWLGYQIGQVADDNCVVVDETLNAGVVYQYLASSRPGSYYHTPSSGGGSGMGAAFGAKLAVPDRDVILVTDDSSYRAGSPGSVLRSAREYGAPLLTVIYQTREYRRQFPSGVAAHLDDYMAGDRFESGPWEPPADLVQDAEAAGAYGESVRDPAEVGPALWRGLAHVRRGTPAVVAVWLPKSPGHD
jgi:acetolactate synthase I/II/III large subunit